MIPTMWAGIPHAALGDGAFLQEQFDIPTGLNLFNASLMLAFMSIPTICSISEDAIRSDVE